MKIRAYQLDICPAAPQKNGEAMLEAISSAKKDDVDLIIFPEMSIPGYLISDEWERESFLKDCEAVGEAVKHAAQDITVIFGNIGVDWTAKNEDGRVRKYNACFIAEDQNFISHPKTKLPFFIKYLMPNYREFDDNRHFYDPRKLAHDLNEPWQEMISPVYSKLGKLGCFICEDGWTSDYNISPIEELANKGVDIFINISCSPYTYDKNQKRYRVFSEHARSKKTPLIYTNAVGLQDNGKTVYTFDGASCIYDRNGRLVQEAPRFKTHSLDYSLSLPSKSGHFIPPTIKQDEIEDLYAAISYGSKRFLQRVGIKKMVIGVSGGIDSAVVAAIYRQILPKDHLLLVNMPGPFTSETTINLARDLAQNLDALYAEIPIGTVADITKQEINSTAFHNQTEALTLDVSDFVFENIQARDRSSRILAATAAAFGGAFSCNANKSEMTVGYSTLYGDLGGCLASIADLWKGEVYAMAHWLNEQIYQHRGIPIGSIDIVPSAELSNRQNVDEGCGDPLHYPYHDALFRSWVERWNRATPEENLRRYINGDLEKDIGFDGSLDALFPSPRAFVEDLERWWNLYQGMAVAKRIQAPPILGIKRRCFGFDHRESQLGPRYSQAYLEMKKSVLEEL